MFRAVADAVFAIIALKHKLDRGFLKKRGGEDLRNRVKGMREHELFFDDGNQDVNGHSNPNLGLHTVGRGAEETLDAQMLLDPFEEQLDLPSLFVERRDCESGEQEIVGQKDEAVIDFVGMITDPSQGDGITLRALGAR